MAINSGCRFWIILQLSVWQRGGTQTKFISKASPPTNTLPDMGGHTGLRGVAAVWIVLFHGLVHSQVSVNIQVSVR